MMFLLSYHAGGETTMSACASLDEVAADIAEEYAISSPPQDPAFLKALHQQTSFGALPCLEALQGSTRIPLDIEEALRAMASHHARLAFTTNTAARLRRASAPSHPQDTP